MAPLSTVSGIASGIDFPALVDQIVAIERRPVDRLQATIDQGTKRKAAIESFRLALGGLKSSLAALKDGSALGALTASAAGTDSVGRLLAAATASSAAVPGSYQLEVLALARAQRTAGAAQPSTTDALGLSGAFSINGTASVTVEIGDSLAAVRDRINALNTGATPTKVTASILSVSATDHRLILTADQPGSAAAFTFAEENGGTVAASLGLDVAHTTAAVDARFRIDGVELTRASNVVSDAIQGVTLTLSSAEPGRFATVKVDRSTTGAQAAAQAFVDAYNKVATFIKDQGKPGAAQPLGGDATLRSTRSTLSAAVLATGVGTAADLSTLSSVGISVTREGTLTLEAAKFQAAYTGRTADVGTLLSERGAVMTTVVEGLLQTGTGALDVKRDAIDTREGTLSSRIADLDSRLAKRRASLLAQFARSEAVIGRLRSIQDSLGTQLRQLSPKDQ